MPEQQNKILIGGCYKKKDEGWLLVNNKYPDGTWQTRDIIIDEMGYDEEIADLNQKQIEKIADLATCYRPYYRQGKGLYAVWDESKPKSEKITLQ